MSVKISALPIAATIDGAADYYPIVTASLGVTQRINRSTFLGVTGAPADISTVQTFTNKVIGITNTITQKDGSFTIQNTSDNTKQVRFSAAGVSAGTTRVLTLPNATATLATLAGSETLTNKTITSPVISGGSIDNTTITVDSIAGHSTSTIVTVAGVQLNNGVINTANAVTAVSIADGGVQPKALVTGTGSGWAWSSWTPTWTNVTVGNGTVEAKFIQIGKAVHFRISIIFGTTTSISGRMIFSLPVTAVTYPGGSDSSPFGLARVLDSGTAAFTGLVEWVSTTTAVIQVQGAAGTYVNVTDTSSTIPMTWAVNDNMCAQGVFEAA